MKFSFQDTQVHLSGGGTLPPSPSAPPGAGGADPRLSRRRIGSKSRLLARPERSQFCPRGFGLRLQSIDRFVHLFLGYGPAMLRLGLQFIEVAIHRLEAGFGQLLKFVTIFSHFLNRYGDVRLLVRGRSERLEPTGHCGPPFFRMGRRGDILFLFIGRRQRRESTEGKPRDADPHRYEQHNYESTHDRLLNAGLSLEGRMPHCYAGP
jgi:hypothetical protein